MYGMAGWKYTAGMPKLSAYDRTEKRQLPQGPKKVYASRSKKEGLKYGKAQ